MTDKMMANFLILLMSSLAISSCQSQNIEGNLQKIATGVSQLDAAINGKSQAHTQSASHFTALGFTSLKTKISGHSGETGAGFEYLYMYFAPDGGYAQRKYNRRDSTVGTWRVRGSNICLKFEKEYCLPARPINDGSSGSYIKWGNAIVHLKKGDVHKLANDTRGENPYNKLKAKGLLFNTKLSAVQHCRNNQHVEQVAFDDFYEGKGLVDCAKHRAYANIRDKACAEKDKGECLARIAGTPAIRKGIDSRKR